MPFALLPALAALSGATLLTYLYDRDAHLFARLCAGAATGMAALGLVGFVTSSFIGLTPIALALSGALMAAPLLLMRRKALRERVRADTREAVRDVRRAVTLRDRRAATTLLFFLAAALLFWVVFGRAAYSKPEGLFTGLENNIGDLPFHIGIVTGFAHGENFPPEHPEYAGTRLTYPFVVDFVTAMFVRAGASLEGSLFWQNFVLALALTGLLWLWALELTRDRIGAFLTPVLVLFNGGLGFLHFFRESTESGRGFVSHVNNLIHYYTMWGGEYKWGNAVTTLLVPQRGLLLGIPLALVVWTLWWKALEEGKGQKAKGKGEKADARLYHGKGKAHKRRKKKADDHDAQTLGQTEQASKDDSPTPSPFAFYLLPFAFPYMLAAGVVAGLLPLVHAHSFVVMMGMGGCLALLASWDKVWRPEAARTDEGEAMARVWERWKAWAVFFAAALALAVPQMLWATYKSDVQAGSFFGWHFGWESGAQSFFVFWLKNAGLFIPLLVIALVWRGARGGPLIPLRLLVFYVPFMFCFIVPNLLKLSPWTWDNIKVIFYWWIASAPLVALVLTRLWRRGTVGTLGALALVFVLTLSGALDVWRVVSGAMEQRVFDRDGLAFAEMIKEKTASRSVILHAPTYNHPVLLTGRRGLVGYSGHLWSHGITNYAGRERDAALIYRGGPETDALLAKHGVEYVVIGPLERYELSAKGVAVNEAFFQRYTKVGQVGGYSLYKTSRG